MARRQVCAAALLITAVIHLAVVPEHAREWPAAAAFFVALSAVEVGLAVILLTRSSRPLLLTGAVISVVSAALWVVSRTFGLPIGPEAFHPEAVRMPDAVATLLEVFAAAVFAGLAIRPTGLPAPAHDHQ